MVRKKFRKMCLILTLCMTMMLGMSSTVYAYVDESASTQESVAVKVEEDISESEKEQEESAQDNAEDSSAESTEENTEENSGAFSEDGNLTLVDDINGEASEGLQYMTVTTKSGATFYIVIDRTSDSQNVYFLNQVDELDLMAIMDDTQKAEYENSVAEKEEAETVTPDVTEESSEPVEEVPEEKTEIQTVNPAVFGVIGVAAIAIVGGYMFMKKKSKKDDAGLEEDLDFYDDEEYENEDDVEEQEIEFVDLEEEEK